MEGQPKYWMEIKKLPGEAELEKLEAKAREKGHVSDVNDNEI